MPHVLSTLLGESTACVRVCVLVQDDDITDIDALENDARIMCKLTLKSAEGEVARLQHAWVNRRGGCKDCKALQ